MGPAAPWIRPLLLAHAVAAAILVGSATHHLIWCRAYLRADFSRMRQERLFALVAALAYAATFTMGLVLYPTYKVRVRAAYLDQPHVGLGWLARLFDIKEMWMAVGVGVAATLLLLSRLLHPSGERRVAPLYVALSALLCISVWGAALIGLLVASYRGVAQ